MAAALSTPPAPPVLPLSVAVQNAHHHHQQTRPQLSRLTRPDLAASSSSSSSANALSTLTSSSPSDEASSSSSSSSSAPSPVDSTCSSKATPPHTFASDQHQPYYHSCKHGDFRPTSHRQHHYHQYHYYQPQQQRKSSSTHSSRPQSWNIGQLQQAVLRDSTVAGHDRPIHSSHSLAQHADRLRPSHSKPRQGSSSSSASVEYPAAAALPPSPRNGRSSQSSRGRTDRTSAASIPFVVPPPQQQLHQTPDSRQQPYSVAFSLKSSPAPLNPASLNAGSPAYASPPRGPASHARRSSIEYAASNSQPSTVYHHHYSQWQQHPVGGSSKTSPVTSAEIIRGTYTYPSADYDDDETEQSIRLRHSVRAIVHLSTLATPLSLIIAMYALLTALFTAAATPFRLVCFPSSRRSYSELLHQHLASALHLQLRCLLGPEYIDYQGYTADDEPSSGSSLMLIHLLAPFLALPLTGAAWVAAFMWGLSAMVLDDAVAGASGAGTAQERRWAGTVIGAWLAWLERGRRSSSSSSSSSALTRQQQQQRRRRRSSRQGGVADEEEEGVVVYEMTCGSATAAAPTKAQPQAQPQPVAIAQV